MIFWLLIALGSLSGLVGMAFRFVGQITEQRKRAAELNFYRGMNHPIVCLSETEFDSTVEQRAERIRALLVESGNKWLTPDDVYAYPFGGTYRTLTGKTETLFGMSWATYRQAAWEFERDVLTAFQVKLSTAAGHQTANQYTAGQRPAGTHNGYTVDWN